MNNKSLLILLWCSSIFFLFVALIAYYAEFKGNDISKDPENWAQFGDYLGGVLNPFISLINLVILTYLSIRLVKDEEERNKWTLQELARPYGEFKFITNEDSIEILVQNFGLGPMVINEIIIKSPDGKIFNNFKDLILAHNKPLNFQYNSFTISNNHCAVGKDREMILFKMIGNENDLFYMNCLKSIILILNKVNIEIKYSDMYKRKMESLTENQLFI